MPDFGDKIRPPVVPPSSVQAGLIRRAFLRTVLSAALIVVTLAVLVLAIRAPLVMATDLFVADGSSFGCLVSRGGR